MVLMPEDTSSVNHAKVVPTSMEQHSNRERTLPNSAFLLVFMIFFLPFLIQRFILFPGGKEDALCQ